MKYVFLALFLVTSSYAAEVIFTPEEISTFPQGPQGEPGPPGQDGSIITRDENGVCTDGIHLWACVLAGDVIPPEPEPCPYDPTIPADDPACVAPPEPEPVAGVFPGVPAYPYRDQLPSITASADVTTCGRNDFSTVNGTPDNWVVVTLPGVRSDRCRIQGSYFVVQNSTFNHKLQVRGPGPWAVRNNEFTNGPTVGGGAINPEGGTDVLIEGNNVHDWGPFPMVVDQQGISLATTQDGIWILSNSINRVAGDSIHGCHRCAGPGRVYIAGNVMNGSWENAMDFKGFRGPIVATCNSMSGYRSRPTSNGEAVRVNDEGTQGELWMSKNTYSNNFTDIAPYSSDAEGYYLDEIGVQRFNDNERSNTQAFEVGERAQPFYDLFQSRYSLDLSADCPQ